jgi:hypothetical protein
MTHPIRYVRRPHRAADHTYQYIRASRGREPWLHIVTALLIVLAVLAGAALFGYWSPSL